MKIKLGKKIILVILIIVLTTPTFIARQTDISNKQKDLPKNTIGSEYKGNLKIYIVEIESRWDMENRMPYEYAFFDYAFNEQIEIKYLETYKNSITWQGDIDEDNVIIIASIFNQKPNRNYADPPLGRPFYAYYVDAAAGVKPGETESNVKNEDFTHTIFCEVGSASWCPACPSLASILERIFKEGEYPFYFVEMVTDKSSQANIRMNHYNLKWLPTAFYDGGYEVVVGGGDGDNFHKNIIEECGEREVHDLDFTLGAEWVGEGIIDININITNNEQLPNNPPEKPTINGPNSGKIGEVYQYQISTMDPDGDEIYYKIDWADGNISDWLGPYNSEEVITVMHSWKEEGDFIVKVKAKDPDGEETEWASLKVTMPKSLNKLSRINQRLELMSIIQKILFLLKNNGVIFSI
jgi:thiol-disulfide isomerase/thioredoxin